MRKKNPSMPAITITSVEESNPEIKSYVTYSILHLLKGVNKFKNYIYGDIGGFQLEYTN